MSEGTLVEAEFDAVADTYDSEVRHSLYGLEPDYFTRVKADFLIDLVSRRFGATSKLEALDVGCGIGNYHPYLSSKFGSLSGIDVSRASLGRASTRNGEVDYRHYDGHRFPFGDQRFDVVFTICVLHHVPPAQWNGFAAEMARVLKPGGMALVFEHNPANPVTRKIVDRCEFDRDAVLLRRSETMALLTGAGLTSVRARCILSIPPIGRWTRNLDFMLGRLGLGAQYVATAEA